MKFLKALVFFISICVIASAFTVLFYYNFVVFDVKEYDMVLIVSDHIGFDVTTEKLHFGMVTPGGSSTRDLIIANEFSRPLIVQIKTSGKLASWVAPSVNNFILQPNETKNVTMVAVAPEDAKYGNYTGKVKIVFRRF